MGNLLLTTPAFSAIRQRLPGVHIGFLTTEAYGFMLTHHRDIDVLYLQSRRMTWNWLAQLRLIREVRRQNYDMVVDCSQGESFLGVVWMMVCGASYRVGEKGSRHEALFNLAVDVSEAKEHRIERLLAVLEAVGIPSAGFAMHIPLPPSCQQWAVNQWAFWTSSGGTRRIGINLGARGEKRWPLE
ncbi:MAG: hypothetical protein KJT03_03835 [Verrucomicrobiae bacterium]|nr:hypothetical protein [Verrucomicrobiae bacterium]